MKTEENEKKAKSFGEGLKMARELRKLSLREVEEATGISNAYLSQLENDKIKKPSPPWQQLKNRLFIELLILISIMTLKVNSKKPHGLIMNWFLETRP